MRLLRSLRCLRPAALLPVCLILAMASLVSTPGEAVGVLSPFIRVFNSQEYDAHAQSWAVVQDPRGVIYIANSSGVLEFDGVTWRTIPVANSSIVRSLAVDETGCVWVGAVGEIGYLEANEIGELEYVSLTHHLPEDQLVFSDVWRTHVTPEGIFFCPRKKAFLWRGGSFEVASVSSLQIMLFEVAGKLYGNDVEKGLSVLDQNRLHPLKGGEEIKEYRIYNILRWDEDTLLIVTATNGLYLFDLPVASDGEGRLRRFPTEADDLFKSARLYSGTALPDGTFALGTMTGGAAVIGRGGELIYRFDRSTGLPDQSVWGLFCDRQQGLWLALNRGLVRVELGSPVVPVSASSGIDGTIEALVRFQGTLYAGTSTGLYALRDDRFAGIEGLQPPCWSFEVFRDQDGRDERLLVGLNGSVNEIANEKQVIYQSDLHNYTMLQSRFQPSTLLIGQTQGALVAQHNGRQWSSFDKIQGIDREVRSVAEDSLGALWLGTHFDGVFRVKLDPDDLKSPLSVEQYGIKHGLPSLKSIKVVQTRSRLLFATGDGLYEYDGEGRFSPSDLFGHHFADAGGILRLIPEDEDRFWISTQDGRAAFAQRTTDERYQIHEAGLRRIPPASIYAFWPEENGTTWIGTTAGLFLYDTTKETSSTATFATLIRDISVRSGDSIYRGFGQLRGSSNPSAGNPGLSLSPIAHEDASLTFTFAAPSFDALDSTEYSYLLQGFDADWSSWSSDTKKEYTNLNEGRYTFRVRARDVYGAVNEQASAVFVVRPPWHRTPSAYIGYLVMAGLFVLAVVKLRSWKLERERDRLEKLVAERTTELRQQTHRLESAQKELEAFSYSVSHDLRAPIRKLEGLTSLLLSAEDEETGQRQQLADRVRANCREMSELIDALLELSRTGRVPLSVEQVDLTEMVEHIAEGLSISEPERSLTLRVAPSLRVTVDPTLMRVVMRNLMDNSWKYTRTRSKTIIEVGSHSSPEHPGETVFFVHDNGVGFDPKLADRLFTPFQRLHPTKDYPGSGIGLATVQRIIHRHGGTIWAESTPDEGATFFFTLES
jgi:signal transduction histidine kinase/ligand-binding sensor domain-containing protein